MDLMEQVRLGVLTVKDPDGVRELDTSLLRKNRRGYLEFHKLYCRQLWVFSKQFLS